MIRILAAVVLVLGIVGPAHAQNMVQPESLEQGFILLVTDKSGTATAESPIRLASNHNGWNPNDPAQRLTQRSDGKWQIVLPKPALDSRMAFKFARGSWETAETAADFKDIENRSLPLVDASRLAPGEKPVIELTIETFADKRPWEPARAALDPYRPLQVTGTVRRVEVVGGGPGSLVRDLLVWLPPGYDDPANAEREYPVLYLMDGQNVFEQLPGVPGEWHADETAMRLIESGEIEPLIIVGVPHAGAGRTSEYLPVEVFDGVQPRGDEFVEFLVGSVVPRVARAFRVRPGPENTGIGGASMGAIIAMHAATLHPEVFGRVLFDSAPLLSKDRRLLRFFEEAGSLPRMVVTGMGAREAGADEPRLSGQYVQAAKDFDAMLGERGMGAEARLLIVDEDAAHNEQAWAERFPLALKFLFPAGN